MYLFHHNAFASVLLLILLLCVSVLGPAGAMPTSVGCTAALSLDAGEPWSWHASATPGSEVVAVEVPAAGWLALEVASRDGAPAPAWVQVLDECGGLEPLAAGQEFLDRGVIEVKEAGTVFLRFGAVQSDPLGDWPTLRLATHHLEASRSGEKDGGLGDNTEEEDGEIVPLVFPGFECEAALGSVRAFAGLDKDGGLGDNTEEEDGEIVPLIGGNDRCSPACAGREPANDLFYCATALEPGLQVADRLDAVDGLDRDYFTFTVGALAEVRIDAVSALRLRATIVDHAGRMLVSEELLDDQALATTLTPGRYFLRVEGAGEGEYRIELEGRRLVF